MFRHRIDHLVALFEEQFAPDGADFIYRKDQKGPAFRISAAERDAMVGAFRRQYRRLFWACLVAAVVAIVLVALLAGDPNSSAGRLGLYGSMVAIVIALLAGICWIREQPARMLDRKPQVAGPLDREAVRQLNFSKITYGQLALVLPLAPLLWWEIWQMTDPLHGWGLLGTGFTIGLVLLAAVQAFRKWRFERGRDIR